MAEVTIDALAKEVRALRSLIVQSNPVVYVSASEAIEIAGRDREWLRRFRANNPDCYKRDKKGIRYNIVFFQKFKEK